MQDEIMRAKFVLANESTCNVGSVIRLLDQTYKKLCAAAATDNGSSCSHPTNKQDSSRCDLPTDIKPSASNQVL